MSLERLETKGDVSFYRGGNGETYQFVNLETDQLVIPSTLGLTEENRYVLIKEFKGYEIKYDGLGEEGFSIWKEEVKLSTEIWYLPLTKHYILDELEFACCGCGTLVSYNGVRDSAYYYVCDGCEETFCIKCMAEVDDFEDYLCHTCSSKK